MAKYEIFAFDINKMPRTRKAWEAMIKLVNDEKWHHIAEVVYVMAESSDIRLNSIQHAINQAISQGLLIEKDNQKYVARQLSTSPPEFIQKLKDVSAVPRRGTEKKEDTIAI